MVMKKRNKWAKEIQTLFERQRENGGPFWSRKDGDIHAPAGFSTIDVLNVLGELGATTQEFPALQNAVNFIMSYQNPDGSFRYAKKSSRLPCMAGRIAAAFGRLGVQEGARSEKIFHWFLEIQSGDGGWRCATVKLGKSPETDASNPGTTLYVLDAFRFRDNSQRDVSALNRGVEFLLRHWEAKEPLGPCVFGIGSRFLKVENPFLRYNLFYYVHVLSHYKKAHRDPRFLEAMQTLASRLDEGMMRVEAPHKAWQSFSFARRGQTSELATKRWQEIEKNLRSIG